MTGESGSEEKAFCFLAASQPGTIPALMGDLWMLGLGDQEQTQMNVMGVKS